MRVRSTPNVLMETIVHTKDGRSVGRFRTLRAAYDAAPDGAVITLPPGNFELQELGGEFWLSKPLTLRGTTRVSPTFGQGVLQNLTTITGMPGSGDKALIMVRNGSGIGQRTARSGVVIERLRIRPDCVPEVTAQRRIVEGIDCIRIEGGDHGTITRVDVIDCELMNAGCGVAVLQNRHDKSDDDLFVRIEGCHIHDMYAARGRDPLGNIIKLSHAHGIYTCGGTITIGDNLIERIGYIRGSTIFTRSNKDQGIYGEKGKLNVYRNTISDVAHCAFQYRGVIVTSTDNIADLCPMGFQFGHDLAAVAAAEGRGTRAIVTSLRDMVRRPVTFPDSRTGAPTLSCGVHFDNAERVQLLNCRIIGHGGDFGGWGGLHFSDINTSDVHIENVVVDSWDIGMYTAYPLAPEPGRRHRFIRISTPNCRESVAAMWRNAGDLSRRVGGTWEECVFSQEALEIL